MMSKLIKNELEFKDFEEIFSTEIFVGNRIQMIK